MTLPNIQLQVNSGSGTRPHAEVLRQLIEYALAAMAKDAQSSRGYLIDECFSMWDPNTIATVKEYLVKHQNIPVVSTYPTSGLGIPQIAVIAVEEHEDAEHDVIGDRTGMIGRGVVDQTVDGETETIADNNIVQRVQLGMTTRVRTDVHVRTEDPTLTTLLAYVVRLIIFINKDQLTEDADIHNLTIDMGAVTYEGSSLFPELAYDRVLSLSYLSNFDYNLPVSVLKRLNFSLLVNLAQNEPADGSLHDELAVPVPPKE